jgi:hypothetical protein
MTNNIAQLDSLLNTIAENYEKATPEEREKMSPFCKYFYDMAQTEKPQDSYPTACNLLESNTVEEYQSSAHIHQ